MTSGDVAADEAEILRALILLAEPGQVVELRALEVDNGRGHQSVYSGYFDDHHALAKAALELSPNAKGVYITLNPVEPALLARSANRIRQATRGGTTGDAQITSRKLLLIDLDAKRPSGISATREEHQASLRLATRIKLELTHDGWPSPIEGDSGNGAHLLYRIDLPGDDGGLVKRVLAGLAARYDDDVVKVDTSVHNAARITKLFGTVARKGDSTKDRPHRLSRVVASPEAVAIVSRVLLEGVAESEPKSKPSGTAIHYRDNGVSGKNFNMQAWLDRHDIESDGPHEWKAKDGTAWERWTLAVCPWNSDHDDRAAYVLMHESGARVAGCHHDSCQGKGWRELVELIEGTNVNPPQSSNEEWKPIIPFDEYAVPPFPVDAFPPWLADYCRALATETQTPPDLAAMLLLSVLAAACAKKAQAHVFGGWYEPLNIYALASLAPGHRKSTVAASLLAPVLSYEHELLENTEEAIVAAEFELSLMTAKLKSLKSRITKEEDDKTRTELLKDARSVNKEIANHHVPIRPRIVADDATPEKLASMLAEQGGRMAIISGESDVFELIGGRYDRKGAPNLGLYLKAHAGDLLRMDRKSSGSTIIDKPALTLGIATQPDVLRGLADQPGFVGRGLCARFLYCVPPSSLGRRLLMPQTVHDRDRQVFHTRIKDLFRILGEEEEERTVEFSKAAIVVINDFRSWVEPQLAKDSLLSSVDGWLSKLPGAVVRIATILTLSENSSATSVSAADTKAAVRIGHYLVPHAKAAFAEMRTVQELSDAVIIVEWLKAEPRTTVSAAEIRAALRGKLKTAPRVKTALVVLTDHHVLREIVSGEPRRPGRPPAERYEVHPSLSATSPSPETPESQKQADDHWLNGLFEKLRGSR
tara:strand:- start:3011 stop:5635 length:2625 start_codon:yes stop_codon:yes gene_type:complete